MTREVVMNKRIWFALFMMGSVITVAQQTAEFSTKEPQQFGAKALLRFQDKLSAGELTQVRASTARWQQTDRRIDVISATDLVYHFAVRADAKSTVTIAASAGEGATIKYQTLGQHDRHEEPTTAKNLSTATEKMYIGRYVVWSERNGKATSDQNSQYDILDKSEKITLEERK